jgi:hypothetical protein
MVTKILNCRKIDQTPIKYTTIFYVLQDPTKYTQILNFGFKICHLATQVLNRFENLPQISMLQTHCQLIKKSGTMLEVSRQSMP